MPSSLESLPHPSRLSRNETVPEEKLNQSRGKQLMHYLLSNKCFSNLVGGPINNKAINHRPLRGLDLRKRHTFCMRKSCATYSGRLWQR
jgi:hypothetical protein